MTGRRDVTIASVQMDVKIGDQAATLARMAEWIDRAAGKGADIVLFPELVLSAGYSLGDKFYDVAEAEVVVIAVLHKRETAEFYRQEAP